MADNYKFYQNRECEYFPCHQTGNPDNFNCLFCFCPLYALGKDCGGNFTICENGIKDCSNCLIPHRKGNYDYMTNKVSELIEKVRCECADD